MKKAFIITLKTLLILYLFELIAFSSFGLYKYNKGKSDSEKFADEIVAETNIKELPISVDFEKLNQKNKDIIGWI